MDGIEKFINFEILDKTSGWKKWVMGAGMELASENYKNIIKELKESTTAKMLGLVDDNGQIDVEKAYHALRKQATDTAEIDLPLIGTLKLTAGDVDKLHNYILNS